MKRGEFDKLSDQQKLEELKKCNSFEYFYNNYCKKEGMPDFSQKEWEEYIENSKKERFNRRRGGYFYPFTPDQSIRDNG